jgi:hypothetical protein
MATGSTKMIEKESKTPTECCFCRSSANLIKAYRTEDTCAGRDFNIYFSCCKACLPKLEPGYTIIGGDEPMEERKEALGTAGVDVLCGLSRHDKKRKTKAPEKAKRRSSSGQLTLFGEEG